MLVGWVCQEQNDELSKMMNSGISGFTRVISYIDGYNLYFGLRQKARRVATDGTVTTTRWKNFYWLDVVKLSETLLQKTQRLVQTKYFTARIRGNPPVWPG